MFTHQSPTPLYQQLKTLLHAQIQQGLLSPNSPIPSERDLCATYNLSRTTVRQAVNELVGEGILAKKQGKGTFVVTRKIAQELIKMTSFEKTIAGQGLSPSSKVIACQEIESDVEIAHVLNLSINEKIIKLVLLGLANDEPMVYYVSFFPYTLGQFMIKKAGENERMGKSFSTYDLYAGDCAVQPVCAQQTFEAAIADAEARQFLGVKAGTPVFLVTSLINDVNGAILEYRKAVYRGDRYKFQIVREM